MDQEVDTQSLEFGRCTTSDCSWQNGYVQLSEHSTGRNKAIARQDLPSFITIVHNAALAAVLLPEQKGLRCDTCFQLSPDLKRCSGCVEYWYCDMDCQTRHWKTIHKYMCRRIAKFRTTIDFQASPVHRQTDAFLLSHLLAEHGRRLSLDGCLPSEEDMQDPLATFASLLPFSGLSQDHPPGICTVERVDKVSPDIIKSLYSRFSNNNFIIHSHLRPVGHGIFPVASRLFNHSCMPNAIVSYEFLPQGVQMRVKTLTDIKSGDEITIPYFDPALPLRRRQEICRFSYGFECACPKCKFCTTLQDIPKPPIDPTERLRVEDLLLKYAFSDLEPHWPSRALLYELPKELNTILHEDFLPNQSAAFYDAAHDGHFDVALRNGLVLLALYVVIYPLHFPQVGIHSLELSKTAYNVSIQCTDRIKEQKLQRTSRRLLSLTLRSLSVLGKEGDIEEGPLDECKTLDKLLNSGLDGILHSQSRNTWY